jgi:hypothetical protein
MIQVFFTNPRYHSWIKVAFNQEEVTDMKFYAMNNRTGKNVKSAT